MIMENLDLKIRFATVDDANQLLAVYAHYVLNTAVSFEYTVPTLDEFKNRIENVKKAYPYLIAEVNGTIVGYCYASAFHEREAYSHDAEISIYIREDMHMCGIGRALYEKMEVLLAGQNIFKVYACIADCDEEDEHLTKASILFHEKMGFKRIGLFENSGYKFGKYYNMIWMEKNIRELPENPEAFLNFSY